jgi:hypothetical protein
MATKEQNLAFAKQIMTEEGTKNYATEQIKTTRKTKLLIRKIYTKEDKKKGIHEWKNI